MKRIVGLMSIVTVMSFGALMLSSSATFASGTGLSANGAGHFQSSGALRTFSFTAITHQDGTVSGEAELDNRGLGLRDHLVILCIVPNSANTVTIGGIIDQSSNPANVGTPAAFTVLDAGPGNQGDMLSLAFFPATCADGPFPLNPIDGGSISIHS